MMDGIPYFSVVRRSTSRICSAVSTFCINTILPTKYTKVTKAYDFFLCFSCVSWANEKPHCLANNAVRCELERMNRPLALPPWLNVCHCARTRFSSVQIIETFIHASLPLNFVNFRYNAQ